MSHISINVNSRRSSPIMAIFDKARTGLSNREEYLRTASRLNRLSDRELADIGINRSEIDETIKRYL